MVTFNITVLDAGELKTITEADIEEAFPNSSYLTSIRNAIEVVLDDRSDREAEYEAMTPEQIDAMISDKRIEMMKHVRKYNALLQHLLKGGDDERS